ncbi:MAG: hypothetical protein ACE5Q6_06560 [Dehalococcoidia bacterium]
METFIKEEQFTLIQFDDGAAVQRELAQSPDRIRGCPGNTSELLGGNVYAGCTFRKRLYPITRDQSLAYLGREIVGTPSSHEARSVGLNVVDDLFQDDSDFSRLWDSTTASASLQEQSDGSNTKTQEYPAYMLVMT